jgi:hypothetical protein
MAPDIVKDNRNNRALPSDRPIIKYKNPDREFSGFTEETLNPSLILDFYPIKNKPELIEFIKSQQMYSWCIPQYYGETNDYFILTSPCFINEGTFTDQANSTINDLHDALRSIISVNDYDFIGD